MFDIDAVGQAAYTAYVTQRDATLPEPWKTLPAAEREIWINVAIAVINRTDQLSRGGIQIGDRNVQNNTYGTHLRR